MHTLNYLNLRARGETVRYMFHYCNVPFIDNVINFDDWPKVKAAGILCPLGQVPSLTLPSGTVIAQSGAIVRYVGRLLHLVPVDEESLALADSVFELTQEMNMINPLFNFFPFESEKWKMEKEVYFNALPMRMKFVQNILTNQTYIGGSSPCFADFALFHILDLTVRMEPDSLDKFDLVLTWRIAVQSLPNIQSYLDSRPNCNNPNWGMKGSFALTKGAEGIIL